MHCEPSEPSVQIIGGGGGSSLAAYRSLRLWRQTIEIVSASAFSRTYLKCGAGQIKNILFGFSTFFGLPIPMSVFVFLIHVLISL
jgi:hypothetical protein